ncbi:MAG: hypothetical protein ACRD9W_17675, partial [Terriglobia bacterium]
NTLRVPNAILRNHPTPAMLTQLALPQAKSGKQQIYVKRDGKLQAVPATFGLSDGRNTAVTADGLKEGDDVVVRFTTASSSPAAKAPSAPGTSGGSRRTPGM